MRNVPVGHQVGSQPGHAQVPRPCVPGPCYTAGAPQTLLAASLDALQPASMPAKCACAQIEKLKGFLDNPTSNTGSFLIGGVKYMNVYSDEPETKLRGKCHDGGCAISKTNQTLVIGIWAVPVPAAACNKIVEALAEYLVSVDY